MLAIFRYPSADALEIARAEEIFEQTLQIIHDQVNEGHQYDLKGAGRIFLSIILDVIISNLLNDALCFYNAIKLLQLHSMLIITFLLLLIFILFLEVSEVTCQTFNLTCSFPNEMKT
jgi:hypothetical protein